MNSSSFSKTAITDTRENAQQRNCKRFPLLKISLIDEDFMPRVKHRKVELKNNDALF